MNYLGKNLEYEMIDSPLNVEDDLYAFLPPYKVKLLKGLDNPIFEILLPMIMAFNGHRV
tara:strand:- start:1775 stop:1951 length:177 start_codon:yes stop_codon:yes gene_type:complete